MSLILEPNFREAGKRYLIALHQGRSEEQSAQVNAKLILILSNHIGDLHVLREAMSLARSGIAES
jgi:5-carboxymethyl-2-hydroxymuconate isomerase